MKKIISILIIFIITIMSNICYAYERISWNGKLSQGKNIYYWLAPGCQYNVSISQAVSKLRYPSGMWNPIVLNRTSVKSRSKMDFYQYNDTSVRNGRYTYAFAERYKPKTNGNENIAF